MAVGAVPIGTASSIAAASIGGASIGTGAVGTALGEPPEVLRFSDPTGGRYAALALHGDRVVGGTMIGLPEAAASMIQFYDSGMPAPTDRLALLFGRALPAGAGATGDPGHLPATAVVCRCNTVTKGALVAAWRAGATDVPALRRETRAGTGCGSCGDTVAGICAWLAQADPSAPASRSVARPVSAEGAA
jgi:assimilatory nitrate reductase electron transfer subunit